MEDKTRAQEAQARAPKPAGDERVFHHGQPSVRARFSQPVVLKEGAVFLLCAEDGDVLSDSEQGLYLHDMRYVSGQALRLDGAPLVPLLADAGVGNRGIFALKDFFTGGTASVDGNLESRESVKQKVKDIVSHEDRANPLSDDDIVARLLSIHGIKVARRTVTKYRKALKIASSRQRKSF